MAQQRLQSLMQQGIAAALLLLLTGCSDPPTVTHRVPSPDGLVEAIVSFKGEGGAIGAADATIVSIVPPQTDKSAGTDVLEVVGNIYGDGTPIETQLKWVGPRTLKIHLEYAEVIGQRHKAEVNGETVNIQIVVDKVDYPPRLYYNE